MSWESTINEFRRVDAQREDYPGEHLVVLGVGVLLLLAAAAAARSWRASRRARRVAR